MQLRQSVHVDVAQFAKSCVRVPMLPWGSIYGTRAQLQRSFDGGPAQYLRNPGTAAAELLRWPGGVITLTWRGI